MNTQLVYLVLKLNSPAPPPHASILQDIRSFAPGIAVESQKHPHPWLALVPPTCSPRSPPSRLASLSFTAMPSRWPQGPCLLPKGPYWLPGEGGQSWVVSQGYGVNGPFVPLYEVYPGLKRQECQPASMFPPPAGLFQSLEELESACRGQTVFFPIGVPHSFNDQEMKAGWL